MVQAVIYCGIYSTLQKHVLFISSLDLVTKIGDKQDVLYEEESSKGFSLGRCTKSLVGIKV